MVVFKLILFLLWTILLPFLTGLFWAEKKESCQGSLLQSLFCGVFVEFALFEALAIPMVFLKCSLWQLSFVWLAISLVLAGVSVYHKRKSVFHHRKTNPSDGCEDAFSKDGGRIRICSAVKRFSVRFTPLLAVILVCILLQVVYITFNQHIDDDDAYYVATAVTAKETNTLMQYNPYTGNLYKSLPTRYVLSAWPLYLAVLSTLTGGLHPTLIAHFLLPALVVVFAYLIYALIGRELFPGDFRKQDLFLLLIVLILSFSGFSIYSGGTFLFIRSWQGKALVAGIIQPAIFYLCRCAMRESGDRMDWNLLFCVVISACMFSSMGVLLSIVPVGVYALVYGLTQKQWRYLPYAMLSCSGAFVCGLAYILLN